MAAKPFDVQRYLKRYKALRNEQSEIRSHWKEIVEYLLPRRGRYLVSEQDDLRDNARKKHQKVINGSARDAMRILTAGLQGGLTSPSRPWFALGLADKDLMAYKPVKQWLTEVRDRMLVVLGQTNWYSSTHSIYEELAGFGTGVNFFEEDFDTVLRCRPFTVGEYLLALDGSGRARTLYRALNMSAEQIKDSFGTEGNRLPEKVQRALDDNRPDTRFELLHVVEPAAFVDHSAADYRGMRYHSCYLLRDSGEGDDVILRRAGYKSLPFAAVRWDLYANDVYGSSCPGMDSLGDIKQLQQMEKDKLEALAKQVRPPMNAPSSMKNTGGTIIPGGVNFIDVPQGGQGFSPAYQVQPDLRGIGAEGERVEKRIQRYFFNDLFLAVINQTKEMTAEEVARRYEEKLMMIGPVLERIEADYLSPSVDRLFGVMDEFGLLPPPPTDLPGGTQISVEYISVLAQAQRMVGSSSIERFTQFVGAVAQFDPRVLARVNFDEGVSEYGQMVGAPPKMLRSDEETQQLLDQQAKQQQAQQMAAMAPDVAKAAKDASQAQVGERNVLEAVTGQ